MNRDTIAKIILEHRPMFEQLGVAHVSVFGSTAREQQALQSDVDLAITLDPQRTPEGLAFIRWFMLIESAFCEALGAPVDVVPEPARKPAVQQAIERDRFRVY